MERLLKILLVDNEEVIHQTVANYLHDLGHTVDRIHNESDALTSIADYDYDLVLVDILIPSMDGFSLLKNIQEISPDMPVIVIAGYENMDLALQAMKLGAVDYLMKPVKLLELDAALEKSVRIRTLMSQRTQDTDTPQADHNVSEERKKTAHSGLYIGLLLVFLLIPLLVIFSPFVGERQAAERVTAEELQAEIARREFAESTSQKNERLYRLLSENVTDIVWVTDAEMQFTYINPAITRIAGYDVEEAMALSWKELWHPECLGIIEEIFEKELAGENTDREEPDELRTIKARLVCSNDSDMWVEVKCISLGNPGERPVGLLVILREITADGQVAQL